MMCECGQGSRHIEQLGGFASELDAQEQERMAVGDVCNLLCVNTSTDPFPYTHGHIHTHTHIAIGAMQS